jgi:hypothetical protein
MALGWMTVLMWLAGTAESSASPTYTEAAVKAAFIVNIARAMDWPDGTFVDDKSPIALCLMGDHPFGDNLTRIAKKTQIRGRQINIYYVSDPARVSGCHILFVAGSEDKRLDKILQSTSGRPILTVGDTPGFGDRGLLVNFYRAGDNIRFEINVRTLDRSGLTASSNVINNARVLGKRP